MEQFLEVKATIPVLIPEDKILIDKVEYHELKKQDFDGCRRGMPCLGVSVEKIQN